MGEPAIIGFGALFSTLIGLFVWVVKRDTRAREAFEKVQSQAFTHTIPRLAETFEGRVRDVIAAAERREALRAKAEEEREARHDAMTARQYRDFIDEIHAQRRELLDFVKKSPGGAS